MKGSIQDDEQYLSPRHICLDQLLPGPWRGEISFKRAQDRILGQSNLKNADASSLCKKVELLKGSGRDFPGGAVAKNLPCRAGDVCSLPDQGGKISHAAAGESVCHSERSRAMPGRSHRPQLRPSATK